jgi:hypothetical protein
MTRVVNKKRNVRRPFSENVRKEHASKRLNKYIEKLMRSNVSVPSSATGNTLNTKYEI